MKYLFTILGIVLTATLLTLYFVWPEKQPEQTGVAVTVNGHALAKAAITSDEAQRQSHSDDYGALLDSAITRELLIQEAQRQKIDKEESFRKGLKSFYEQSLIKTLTDRQYSGIQVSVEVGEIDAYLSFYGKLITFSRLPVSSEPPYTPASTGGTHHEVLFDDLSESLQLTLATLKLGESATHFDTGSDRYAIRLDKVLPAPTGTATLPDRESVRQLLLEHKRQEQLVKWLDKLRNNASITITNG